MPLAYSSEASSNSVLANLALEYRFKRYVICFFYLGDLNSSLTCPDGLVPAACVVSQR